MVNLIITLSKLTGLANYFFWEIYVKSVLALIIYSDIIFTTKNMLNDLVLSYANDIDKVLRRNFLGSQALAVLNFTLPDNLLIYSQSNTEVLWTHL